MDPSKEAAFSTELEALKKKVAELDATLARAKHISAAVVVSTGILLGVGILRVPATVSSEVNDYIKEKAEPTIATTIEDYIQENATTKVDETIEETAAKEVPLVLQKELDRRGLKPAVVGTAQRGCAVVGPVQYCWGTAVTEQPPATMHTRQFDLKFARAFVNVPTVTLSVLTQSTGTTYAIYGFERTPEGLSGRVVSNLDAEGKYTSASHKVTVAYFAVAPTTRGTTPEE